MYRAPGPGLSPRAHRGSQSLPPCLLVPGIWSAKQISNGIKKLLVPTTWSRGCLQLRPKQKPHRFRSPKPPVTRTRGADGSPRTLRMLSLAGLLRLLPLCRPPSSARLQGGSWSNTWEGGSGRQQAPASRLLSHSRLGRGREGSWG